MCGCATGEQLQAAGAGLAAGVDLAGAVVADLRAGAFAV